MEDGPLRSSRRTPEAPAETRDAFDGLARSHSDQLFVENARFLEFNEALRAIDPFHSSRGLADSNAEAGSDSAAGSTANPVDDPVSPEDIRILTGDLIDGKCDDSMKE